MEAEEYTLVDAAINQANRSRGRDDTISNRRSEPFAPTVLEFASARELMGRIAVDKEFAILANKDAALLLSFSLIMLNTDQHNVQSEIRTTPEQGAGFPEMTPSRWIVLMHKSKKTAPFIVSDSPAYLDHDMFAIMSGPTISAISVVFDHAEHEDVYQT
ncbi:hypothetical protein Tsubulata_028506 [Turnera subulata]|uniref:SEC7 domain-containing protein n=1 Tax=Turnera subulata TaxID=218843 RepID=A0A9Q0FRT9_9ROSI|nr:hypothetical protein Tsubulata_028506 [Turnera subulata]